MRTAFLLSPVFLLASACSWIGMTRPPPPPFEPTPPVQCTTSRALPILDATAAAGVGLMGLVTTVYGVAVPACNGGWCLLQPSSGAKAGIIAGGLVALGFATMEAFSASYGIASAERCEEVRGLQLACASGVEDSCAALRAPPPAPRGGKSLGERCQEESECREGATCSQGYCMPAKAP